MAVTRRPTDMEAIMAAWILSDAAMLRVHDSVDRYRSTRTAPDGTAAIAMDAPVPAMARPWTFEVVEVACQEGARRTFLVTRILAAPFKPPFDRLEITHHLLAKRGDGPPIGARLRVPGSRPIPRMQERDAAGSGTAPVEATMDGALLQLAHEIEIIRLSGPAGGPPPPLVLVGEDARDVERGKAPDDGSTGDRQPGGGAALVIGRRRRDLLTYAEGHDARAASRRATWLASVDVAQERNWEWVRGSLDDDGDPTLESVAVGKIFVPLLVLCLRAEGCDVVVADAGTAEAGGLSLGLLARRDRARFDAGRDLAAIRGFASLTGARWGTSKRTLQDFVIVSVARVPTGVWKRRVQYRDLISEGMDELLAGLGAFSPVAPP